MNKIRSLEELEALDLPPSVRHQLREAFEREQRKGARPLEFAGGGKRAPVGRPEQAAGAALIRWVDRLYLPAIGLLAPERRRLPMYLSDVQPDQVALIPAGMVCLGHYFAHNANGGARSRVEAGIFKGQGVRKGWPDYTLYWPVQGRHGAVLELKAVEGSKPEGEQLDILIRLETMGYAAMVAWGFEDAKRQLRGYLDLD